MVSLTTQSCPTVVACDNTRAVEESGIHHAQEPLLWLPGQVAKRASERAKVERRFCGGRCQEPIALYALPLVIAVSHGVFGPATSLFTLLCAAVFCWLAD